MSLEAISNGGPHTNSVCEKEGAQNAENNVHPNAGGTSRRISAVRKTLAGWLRLDRSTSTQPASSHKIAQRSKSIENVRLAGSSGASRQTKNSEHLLCTGINFLLLVGISLFNGQKRRGNLFKNRSESSQKLVEII